MTLLELVARLTLNSPNLPNFLSASHSFPLQIVSISDLAHISGSV